MSMVAGDPRQDGDLSSSNTCSRHSNADLLASGTYMLKGPFGQVVVIDEANRLILVDTVANLRGMIKMTRTSMAQEGTRPTTSLTYVSLSGLAAIRN